MSAERLRAVKVLGAPLEADPEVATEDNRTQVDHYTANEPDLSSQAVRPGDLALLTPDQLCSLLQVKKSWVYDQVERGLLPCLRLGKQLRFRQRDVRRYLDDLAR
jgi:excisionase family DNA binding protein